MNITAEEILYNPSIVETMSSDDIEAFEQKYYRKQIRHARNVINKRKQEINDNMQYVKRMNNAYEHIECIWFMLQGMLAHHDPEHRVNRFGRLIGNAIHDMPHIWSGMESEKSLQARSKSKKYNPTDEHYYPRQYAGEMVLQAALLYEEKFTMQTLAKLLYKFCHVHKVTKEENKKVEVFQKPNVFNTPEEAYELAGIELQERCSEEHAYGPVFKEIIELLY